MEKIKTIKELTKQLNEKSSDKSYLDILKQMEIPIHDFEKHYSWNRDRYTRNSLVKTEDYELLLICYEKDQETPIHDFDSKEAWVHTLQGMLREERYKVSEDGKRLVQLSSMTLGINDYSFISQIGIHRYKNIYEARTVTLNLYSKPIDRWTQYDENANKTIVKVSYDSVYV